MESHFKKENNKYSFLYEKEEGIYYHFKRYVIQNLFPLYLILFIILNSILLIAYQQWQDSIIKSKKLL